MNRITANLIGRRNSPIKLSVCKKTLATDFSISKNSGYVYPNKPFERILVVIKHTPYEMYKQLKIRGEAPLALRWERLKNRHNAHLKTVSRVLAMLGENRDLVVESVGREELGPQHVEKAELIVALGGDGTVLSTSHFLDSNKPLVGINTDPMMPSEHEVGKKTDERRSHGAICYCCTNDMNEQLPMVLAKEISPVRRTRIQTVIRGPLKETKLPPALNDILLAHPSPAAVSRFRLGLLSDMERNGLKEEVMYLNVWSSGVWVSTALGSTAAMAAAGGIQMPRASDELQYMVREHLLERGYEHLKARGHGMVGPLQKLNLRWNSQEGMVYVDGSHVHHHIQVHA